MFIVRDVHDLISSRVQDEDEQRLAQQRHADGQWTPGKSRDTGMVRLGYFPTNHVTELRVHWMSNEETDSRLRQR